MKIAVAGGTGLIGTMIVEALIAGGDTPIVLARSAGVDLTTGEGLDARLAGDREAGLAVAYQNASPQAGVRSRPGRALPHRHR